MVGVACRDILFYIPQSGRGMRLGFNNTTDLSCALPAITNDFAAVSVNDQQCSPLGQLISPLRAEQDAVLRKTALE